MLPTHVLEREALAAVLSWLRGQVVISFIDNQAACFALVKSSSSHPDLSFIATVTQLMLAELGYRVYSKYLVCEANAAASSAEVA